ncbi:YdeI family protein [Demequina sp. NBRC 110057]|uniref:YdeI/OmpD-associated family protein n=1 Tax=Demequina sp. NBRC 110057 TaxID=1570346 RepID=UPI000A00B102|nr:YdeI/OmpD-associated family protein [Demequina sp. NBRC 110057]
MPEPERLTVPDASAWREWLDQHEDTSDGVWLILTKKAGAPDTTLTYAQALEEALCSGWIDGRRRSLDDRTFQQHFTPRRARSIWSQRNVGFVATLIGEGRMRPRGQAEIDRAKADGRWDRAYAGQAAMTIPDDLTAALAAQPGASAAFDALPRAEQFSHLHQVVTAADAAKRLARIAKVVERVTPG